MLLYPFGPGSRRAFTLVELLSAIAVLSIILVLASEMLVSTQTVVGLSTRSSATDAEARQVLQRIELDMDNIVLRGDVFYTQSGGGNLFLSYSSDNNYNSIWNFCAAVNGYSGDRTTAQVGYQLMNDAAGKPQLERGSMGYYYSAQSGPITLWPSGSSPTLTQIPDTDYQVIGPDVFRFEVAYLCNSTPTAATPTWTVYPTGGLPTPSNPSTPTAALPTVLNVHAVIVAIAVLDAQSRSKLTQNQLETLARKLKPLAPPVVASTATMADQWEPVLTNGQLSSGTGIPAVLVASTKVYQRVIRLNQN